MPTTPQSQASLASDPDFLRRLSGLLLNEALVVAGVDAPGTPRRTLAQSILTQPEYQTRQLAPAIVNATNLVAANTTYDFASASTVTDADDAAIRSQIASLWDVLAGV